MEDGTAQPDVCWMATLVESRRVNGKPKQTHVAYLGSMTESGIEIPCWRGYFWEKVTAHLDRLGNRMTPDERKTIEAAIAEKVSPISKEELEECRHLADLAWAALTNGLGRTTQGQDTRTPDTP